MSFICEITKKMVLITVGLKEEVNNLIMKLIVIINSKLELKLLFQIKVDYIIKSLEKLIICILLQII